MLSNKSSTKSLHYIRLRKRCGFVCNPGFGLCFCTSLSQTSSTNILTPSFVLGDEYPNAGTSCSSPQQNDFLKRGKHSWGPAEECVQSCFLTRPFCNSPAPTSHNLQLQIECYALTTADTTTIAPLAVCLGILRARDSPLLHTCTSCYSDPLTGEIAKRRTSFETVSDGSASIVWGLLHRIVCSECATLREWAPGALRKCCSNSKYNLFSTNLLPLVSSTMNSFPLLIFCYTPALSARHILKLLRTRDDNARMRSADESPAAGPPGLNPPSHLTIAGNVRPDCCKWVGARSRGTVSPNCSSSLI